MLQLAVNLRSSGILAGKNEFVTCAEAFVYWTYQNISVGDLCLPLGVNQMTKAAKMKINKFPDVLFSYFISYIVYIVQW